jgi:extracellular matrix regulatory protein A
MNRLINIGFGNVVNSNKIVGIIRPEAAPIKRMVQNAKDSGTAIDATCGRKTKAVLVMDSGHLVLSALLPETISNRVNVKEGISNEIITNILE